eukprot:749611-Hanusia_phi.AAC.1
MILKIYDLTDFKHPGGNIALTLGKDRDATELFESHHLLSNMEKITQIMEKYEIDMNGDPIPSVEGLWLPGVEGSGDPVVTALSGPPETGPERMAAKRGRGGGRGGRAGATARPPRQGGSEPRARTGSKGTLATSLGKVQPRERDPASDPRQEGGKRLAREAENKVSQTSMQREARLARDRARKAKKRAAEASADREARLQKEALRTEPARSASVSRMAVSR